MDKEIYEVLALKPFSLNDQTITTEMGYVQINAMDKVHFYCAKCYLPHLYYFLLPTKERSLQQLNKDGMNGQ